MDKIKRFLSFYIIACFFLTTYCEDVVTTSPILGHCIKYSDYACQLPNATVVNLLPLCTIIEKNGKSYLKTDDGLKPTTYYYFNPCKSLQNLKPPCNGPVVSCQEKSHFGLKNKGILAPTSPRFMTFHENVVIQYSLTSPYNVTGTTVFCDCETTKKEQVDLKYEKLRGESVVLRLRHICCCAGACENGLPPDVIPAELSMGSIMLIVFFVLIGVYLAIGVIYNFRDGEHGKYLIPQVLFWERCVTDVKIGFLFCIGSSQEGDRSYTNFGKDDKEPPKNFGEDIVVNYHNPESDYSRPATSNYGEASGFEAPQVSRGKSERGYSANSGGEDWGGESQEVNEADEEYRRAVETMRKNSGLSRYGAL